MLDIKWIRAHPEQLDEMLAMRGMSAHAASILDTDKKWRDAVTALEKLRHVQKSASSAALSAQERETQKQLKVEIAQQEQQARLYESQLQEMLLSLPNVLAQDVPLGKDSTHNILVRHWGEPLEPQSWHRSHDEIGAALGMLDAESAARLSGSRFVVLSDALAALERVMAGWMIQEHVQRGYTEVSVPFLVNEACLYGTGQLPKFAQDCFVTTEGKWLIPTAEVPVTNLVREKMLMPQQLPLRYVAFTPCFRSEAGAAGRDLKGLIRLHQFSKVELVHLCTEEQEPEEWNHLLASAENILQKLHIPYRVMVLCSGDTGFGAKRTYDLEVWLPGQKRWCEISSCSTFGTFQARRMKASVKSPEGGTRFLCTLNGSALPLGRTIAALLEVYQQPDGSVVIPQVLRPLMGGKELIQAR